MIKKLLLAVIGVVVVVGGIVYVKLGQFGDMAAAGAMMTPPPETVTTMVVEPARWKQSLSATGTLSPVQGVMVGAETAGRVKQIGFESGAQVQAGDVLVQIDAASETAQLASAEAAAELARATLERRRELGKRQIVSPADIDAAAAQAKEAGAQVNIVRAAIAKKTIRAPFAGRLGLRQVNVGQILREGDPIVSLQTLDPIHVDFPIPQQDLARLRTGMTVHVVSDAAPGRRFEGRITAISPEVDIATRQLRVRAQVANERELLRAGMFVNVDVDLPEQKPVLPVAASAIVHAPYGDSVFVVEKASDRPRIPENGKTPSAAAARSATGSLPAGGRPEEGAAGKASGDNSPLVLRQQFVRLGEKRGDFVAIDEGLKPGETVVTSGVFKLRTGMPVVVDNTLAPKPELSPRPGRQ